MTYKNVKKKRNKTLVTLILHLGQVIFPSGQVPFHSDLPDRQGILQVVSSGNLENEATQIIVQLSIEKDTPDMKMMLARGIALSC